MKIFILAILLIMAASCGNKKEKDTDKSKEKNKTSDKVETKQNRTGAPTALDNYDIESSSPKVVELGSELLEISGITFTSNDRLFGHGDEDADIFEIDYSTGKVIKKFYLGELLVVKGDFEDIAAVNDKFYLVESKGKLFEFKEGENNKSVEYKTYKTELSSKNDVEGLCYDSETNSLLMACKESGGEDLGKDKAVYSFSLGNYSMDTKPKFVIPQKDIKSNTTEGKFNPSGIARNPVSRTFFIIAARGNTILELSPDGTILNQKDLPERIHKQAEGIAFKKDGTLFISNEGRGKTPTLVMYEMKK